MLAFFTVVVNFILSFVTLGFWMIQFSEPPHPTLKPDEDMVLLKIYNELFIAGTSQVTESKYKL